MILLKRFAHVLLFVLLIGGHTALWIALPTGHFHPDALDELLLIESDQPAILAKHPAAEPTVWGLYHVLLALGYPDRSLRLVQIWNGAWMTVALAGVYFFAARLGGSLLKPLAAVVFLGSPYCTLHLALDPYTFYFPPAFALITWAMVLCRRPERAEPSGEWGGWFDILYFAGAAVLFNPMIAVLLPVVGQAWWSRARPEVSVRWVRGLQLGGVLIAPFCVLAVGVIWSTSGMILPGGTWGTWQGMGLDQLGVSLKRGLLGYGEWNPYFGKEIAEDPRLLFLRDACLTGAVFVLMLMLSTLWLGWILSPLRGALWLVGLGAITLGVIWWDYLQPIYWAVPIWVLTLAWIEMEWTVREQIPAGTRRWCFRFHCWLTRTATLLLGIAFATYNALCYVVPGHFEENPRIEKTQLVSEEFEEADCLVFRQFQDLYLEYFGGLNTTGMAVLAYAKEPDETTFDALYRLVAETHEHGGKVYFNVPVNGEPWIPDFLVRRGRLDFTQVDFKRIQWGRTIISADYAFKEIRAIRRATVTPLEKLSASD